MKRTKIVCTIGPASDKKTILAKLLKAGMNVARLNFSHNVHKYHQSVIRSLREVSKRENKPLAIIQDLQGPRIRIGGISETGIQLKKGQEILLTTGKSHDEKKIPVTYTQMHEDVESGQRILIADGTIELEVKNVKGKDIQAEVIVGGKLLSHKGMNLPDTNVRVPALSDKDVKDLEFGVKNKVDFVALSFVRTAKEVYDVKYLIKKYIKKHKIEEKHDIKIIVKIERKEAIENLNEIIEATDGVMVARGDLGIELPAEDVPLIQKMIIDKCLQASKPVIVATQMLDSMIKNPRPTRAEVSDVANAVIDHTDAVMLSGETASGSYPVETVEMMSKIIERTEKSAYDDLVLQDKIKKIIATDEAISSVAKMLAEHLKVELVLVASLSGYSGRIVSRYRPDRPILVVCDNERVKNQLNLSWGVQPFILPKCDSLEELVERSIGQLKKQKFIKKEDKIIIIAGEPVGRSGNINLIEIKNIS